MTTEKKLEEILDVDIPVPAGQNTVTNVVMVVEAPDLSHYANNTIAQDSNESRTHIRTAICQLSTAITEMLAIARATGKPRSYEVAANMLKTLAEMNHDLLEVHQREQNLLQPENPVSEGDVNIGQAVFVGSTADLADLVKQKREKRNQQHANTIEVKAQTVEETNNAIRLCDS